MTQLTQRGRMKERIKKERKKERKFGHVPPTKAKQKEGGVQQEGASEEGL